MLWWRVSQISLFAPLFTLLFSFLAWSSYGTKEQVFTSWGGNAAFKTLNGTSADHKYLMWRATDPQKVKSGSLTLIDNLNYLGYDSNADSAFYYTLVSGVIDLSLAGLSFFPFQNYYFAAKASSEYNQSEDFSVKQVASDPQFNVYGCDLKGKNMYGEYCNYDAVYDKNGCDQYGSDIYGQECNRYS